jgi:hypothetical protein
MSDPRIKHDKLLQEHGFKLVRHNKHLVYQNHEGKVVVVSATPSDRRSWQNATQTIKHVIANPAKPIILAISDFEREQAALLIRGKERKSEGGGSGKAKRSKGTGFIYEDKVEDAVTLRRREEVAHLARTNRERRDGRTKDRRKVKLERRAVHELARREEDRIFDEHFGGFMKLCSRILEKSAERFHARDVFLQERPWWCQNNFYEFKEEHKVAIKMFKSATIWMSDRVLSGESASMIDHWIHTTALNKPADTLGDRQPQILRVMAFVKQAVREEIIVIGSMHDTRMQCIHACPLMPIMDKLILHEKLLLNKVRKQARFNLHGLTLHDCLFGRLASRLEYCVASKAAPSCEDFVMIRKEGFGVLRDGRSFSVRYDDIEDEVLEDGGKAAVCKVMTASA